ncbi:putative amidohydrolase [Leucobacter luti]|uniref:nitrilase-related carbon-nitrogen hydrolase n=1 Tax=Leucobacter luti TaxID=340320 RepID=UPI00104B85BD|nr:nitrilase-related carbon-nitrogen hydrolase [Leucobacter luti]MCW2287431.1 putative amidohydrolase [Leucobacter luti]TCK41654.1 putative amidohydrolase [Leucobacter luti]
MSPTQLRVEIRQETPAPRDPATNIEHVRATLVRSSADLIVFPELYLTGYQTRQLDELAMTEHDVRLDPLRDACRDTQTALLVGFISPLSTGYSDAYLAIDTDGHTLEAIHKTHLFGTERDTFRAGDHIDTITLCGTQIGVLNCFELEFPEVARTLALHGAELLITGSANMRPYERDHRIAAQARARENRLPLAYANRVGTESGHSFCGLSCAVSPTGEVLGTLDAHAPGSLVVDFTLAAPADNFTDMLAQRRPSLYS